MTNNKKLEFDDIQGLVVRGYGDLPAAAYLLLEISAPRQAMPWLRGLLAQITFADNKPEVSAVNLALTYQGLQRLGLDENILKGFSNEFRSGMSTLHKRRILGDEGDDAPEHWLWGGPATTGVDVLLLCYANSEERLETLCGQLRSEMKDHGLKLITQLDTQTLPDFKEHFGFRDSIGQPFVQEFDRSGRRKEHPVPLGELLLGYRNGYDRYTQRPLIPARQDPNGLLKQDVEGSPQHDLGCNGTYLVFRQLAQDVPGFWKTMQAQANRTKTVNDPIQLASKLVGRWPSGTALVQSPDEDRADEPDKDNFTYHASDAEGLKCPLGAHIRRTHPRDSLPPEPGSKKSFAFSNRHRLLRRGRVYGKPYHDSLDPARYLEDLEREMAPVSRGLHFICLNANIGRQFEFVQHTWANNRNFNGLYKDPDPLIGARKAGRSSEERFTIQQRPARCQIQDLPAFVSTRGGGYFFLPSRRALTFLLSTPASALSHEHSTRKDTVSKQTAAKYEPYPTPG